MKRYKNDPFWLITLDKLNLGFVIAKFGNCKECKTELKGKKAFYYPLTKECFCEKCGEKHSNDFNAACFDECVYNNSF